MVKLTVLRSSPIARSHRVAQIEGLFDVPPSQRSTETWSVNLPHEERDWNIGLIVGPSGSGKSTIAREVFPDAVTPDFEWPATGTIVDAFPAAMSIKDVAAVLSSVGFSSPPQWLRPYSVLSTGQQMRVNVARLLALNASVALFDEFTSVVDRTVAQIGSAALAKAVRRRQQRFVAVSCHYDIIDWLQPDWTYEPHTDRFDWRSLQRRPPIELSIQRVHHSAWRLFRQYHYLNLSFNKAARAFVALFKDRPVALQAVIVSPHPKVRNLYRGHRAVCLPDYQGVGIGNALIDYIASAYRALGNRILSTTASPALTMTRARSPQWRCNLAPHLAVPRGASASARLQAWTPALSRLTSTWEYIGPTMDVERARSLIYG